MFAVGGMLLFPAANDLLTMFVALEVLSLPLYLLCGLARRRRLLSQEAALKYFLLGAFSSAFFLYGVALLYGYAGTRAALAASPTRVGTDAGAATPLLLIGIALRRRRPAVQGRRRAVPLVDAGRLPGRARPRSPAFMAACTKVAAFGALLRVFYVALGGLRWDWRPMMWGVAILTMVVGSVRRAHPDRRQADAGLLLDRARRLHPRRRASRDRRRGRRVSSGVLFYLLAYGFTTIGAFAVVTLVRDAGGEATHLSQWAGLGQRSPLVAGGRSRCSCWRFAGIPLTSGFTGKFAVFTAAIAGGATAAGRRRRARRARSRRSSTSGSSC